MEKFENIYVSSNCNQCTNALHWGNNNLICFASCNSVCIYDPEFGSGGKVTHTLAKHKSHVNSVRWLKGLDIPCENEIISGSSDGNIIVWTLKELGQYSCVVLNSQVGNMVIVDGVYKGQDKSDCLVIGASIEGKILIWCRKTTSDQFIVQQTIDFGYNICIALRLFVLDPINGSLILAVSLDDSSIRFYLEEETIFKSSSKLKGHEDWVCGLDFINDGDDVLLASSSQDNFIRIWRLSKCEKKELIEYDIMELKGQKWNYRIQVESVLMGHEGWVYSVAWNPENKTLLSSSWDKTMVIWEYDEDNKLWMDNIRVGEVGGNTLGFFGGMFSPDGDKIIGYSYHGAFHIWKNNGTDWDPTVTVGGHFKPVNDISWDPQGSYLFSISSDQTCRIHAPWPTEKFPVTWHEIARPQVHGYDMNSMAVFSKFKYASASEEKVIRTFSATQNFVDNFRRICRVEDGEEGGSGDAEARGASVPSLGLSNKAIYGHNNNEQAFVKNSKEMYPQESHFTAVDLEDPPTEETLLQNTLWPEIRKLYGHGYEVYCLAASPDGKFLASACKSTTQEHSALLIWNTSDWKQVQKLISHTLTITQIAFSPDSLKILTVSRDRRWSIFEKNQDGDFVLAGTTNKTTGIHTRIIWCCAWTFDSKFFVTGSRDGKLGVWRKNQDKTAENVLGQYESASNFLSLPKDSITAVDSAPCCLSGGCYFFGVGLETGIVHFYKWSPEKSWELCLTLDESTAHHLTVKRIRFRPVLGQAGHVEEEENKNLLQVATCSADSSVKLFNLYVNKL